MRASELTAEHVGKQVSWRCWDYPDYPQWRVNPRRVLEYARVTPTRVIQSPNSPGLQDYPWHDGAVMIYFDKGEHSGLYAIPGHWDVTVS